MSVVINTNYAAASAANNLAASNAQLSKSLNRLSSGSKITSPADDAGGLAVSMKLSATARRMGAYQNNIANGVSFLNAQDGAYKVAAKILDRMSELATLKLDTTKTSDDTANYDIELAALDSQLADLGGETFNGIALFGSIEVATGDGTSISLGERAATFPGSLSAATVDELKTAIQVLATDRAANGSEVSRLQFAAEFSVVNKANLEAANSRIIDVDIAHESTQLARWNIMVQAGTAMLAQANQSPQAALRLIQG
ncbi:MAG: flagellin [Candidatus Didemnitutus sp.]|nr:flagellin [Candidatus Didemnitutus sp.]